MPKVSYDELFKLSEAKLIEAGASPEMASSTSRALLSAEILGLAGHGLFRVSQYSDFLKSGRADGGAVAKVTSQRGGAVNIDAGGGLAFPALDLAVEHGMRNAQLYGISMVSISRSHHAGALSLPVERIAQNKMIGIAMTNAPAAIAAPNGKTALVGTNPIAAAFPRTDADPLVIDMALSTVARSRLIVAAKSDTPIPLGWAVDVSGVPTTDPKAGLRGSMTAIGGVKGALLAIMVELICAGLSGSRLSLEVDPLDISSGNHPMLGHALIVIDPSAFGGQATYLSRVEDLVEAMLSDEAVRLPGANRQSRFDEAHREGIEVNSTILGFLQTNQSA